MIQNEGLKALIDKYQEGRCSEEEIALLEGWYLNWNEDPRVNLTEEELNQARQRAFTALKPLIIADKKLWPQRAIVAAAAVAAIVFGTWFFFAPKGDRSEPGSINYANDLKPGSHKATLTLANGKTINLSDAKTGVIIAGSKLTYSDGSKVRVSSGSPSLGSLKGEQSMTGPVGDPSLYNKEQLTATTPRGGTYQIILPDGTHVWLNADSKITFPSRFSGKERRIMLKGEAYFEVATAYIQSTPGANASLGRRRTKQSFIVTTSNQQVEVLGTHFNINSYADEAATKTTLLEGSVNVISLRSTKQSSILKPGQQSINNGSTIEVQPADTQEITAWKDGDFRFNAMPLFSIMKQLERWYNIRVEYQGNFEGLAFGGVVSRSKNISAVLEIMESTKKVHFEIKGNTVIVKK